jgi:chromate transport protein ChrA
VVVVITALIAVVVVVAVWNLAVKKNLCSASCCRKIIVLDVAETDALHAIAFAAAILALGVVYWLIRNRDLKPNDRL